MSVAVHLVAGLVAGYLLWPLMRPLLAHPLFSRTNFRGRTLPTAGGLAIVVAVLAVSAVALVIDVARDKGFTVPWWSRGNVVVLVLGFGLLGLLDDLAGDGDGRGFRGHVRSLAQGRLSTGMVKLAGGAMVAIVVAVDTSATLVGVLRDGALIALAANLGNLFDRAPGRTIKVSVFAAIAIGLTVQLDARLAGPAVVLGAALALAGADLREQMMLGDTGANVLGAALGFGVCAAVAPPARTWVLVALVMLNAASEVVSFSRVINRVAILRYLDRLGRDRA